MVLAWFPGADTCLWCAAVQAGAYFSEALNEQLVDALLDFGERQLVGTSVHLWASGMRPLHLTATVLLGI
jgi:hypothetical protein